jgi:hypothetical protein
MAEARQYFSQLKKSLLTKLVRKHKDLVENEKNDYKTIQQKNSTWEALFEQLNSQSGVTKRDSKQLKKCWENVNARAKKQLAKEKREVKLTGGGPSTSKQDDEAAAVVHFCQIVICMQVLYNCIIRSISLKFLNNTL